MGLSSSKQKQTQNSTASATTQPIVPGYIQGPAQNFYGQVGNLLNPGQQPGTYGPSTLQQAAFNGAAQLNQPNANIEAGLGSLRDLLSFRPGMAVNEYMNPYESGVIDAAMGDLGRFQDRTLNNVQSQATRQGAFSNSRLGVERALTNESFGQQAADTATRLRSQGFDNAYSRALGDANFRLGGAQSLLAGGFGADANARGNIETQSGLGDQQRAISMQNDPAMQRAQWLQAIGQILGIDPSQLIGQQVNSTGTATSTTKNSGSGLDAIGQIMQIAMGASKMFPSDRRLKRDIDHRHTDENGLRWYTYRYLWDDEQHYGVMADEAPAHAVHVHPSGYLMVDYSQLEARP